MDFINVGSVYTESLKIVLMKKGHTQAHTGYLYLLYNIFSFFFVLFLFEKNFYSIIPLQCRKSLWFYAEILSFFFVFLFLFFVVSSCFRWYYRKYWSRKIVVQDTVSFVIHSTGHLKTIFFLLFFPFFLLYGKK